MLGDRGGGTTAEVDVQTDSNERKGPLMSATADAAVTRTDPDFVFTSTVDDQQETADIAGRPGGDLGPLAQLVGTWKGHGFNTIWRPHHGGGQDRFLELNLTTETLVFTRIN